MPSLEERQRPGLSQTLRERVTIPCRCQACGGNDTLRRWLEHDPNDQPTPVIVVLCRLCSEKLIEPHPRLYRALQDNQPWTGCMGICVRCVHRRGNACQHPDAKANGGPGIAITIKAPIRVILCPGGPANLWDEPATACSGRETRP